VQDAGSFAVLDCGLPNGVPTDEYGNVWSSADDGLPNMKTSINSALLDGSTRRKSQSWSGRWLAYGVGLQYLRTSEAQ